MDDAEIKSQFAKIAAANSEFVAAASGLCGIGGAALQKKKLGNLTIVGDFCTGLESAHPYAPRVVQAAALMADSVLEYLLK